MNERMNALAIENQLPVGVKNYGKRPRSVKVTKRTRGEK
jgi:hypothetical protein